jgi:hypothetical protein
MAAPERLCSLNEAKQVQLIGAAVVPAKEPRLRVGAYRYVEKAGYRESAILSYGLTRGSLERASLLQCEGIHNLLDHCRSEIGQTDDT